MHDEIGLIESTITCPFCWQEVDVLLDPSAGSQTYVEDCQVCCNPLVFRLSVEGEVIQVTVQAESD